MDVKRLIAKIIIHNWTCGRCGYPPPIILFDRNRVSVAVVKALKKFSKQNSFFPRLSSAVKSLN